MTLRNYKDVSQTFRDYDGDNIGISKDAYIRDKSATEKTYNYGGSSYLYCGGGSTNGNYHSILKVVMPEESDIVNFGKLIKVELVLRIDLTSLPTTLIAGIVSISDIWDEGALNGAVGACNWTDAQGGPIVWQEAGAIKSRFNSVSTDDGTVYDTKSILASGVELEFDLTPALGMGDDKTFVIFPISSSAADVFMYFDSTEHGTTSYRPGLKITYRDYSPDVFDDKDDALTIEPNPDNPEQPLLKWGGCDDADFVDFKLYRDTSAITTIAGMTGNGALVTTITDNSDQEYIDTFSHVDGTKYYYVVIAEDGNNTGDGATFSKNVNFTKPVVNTATLSPNGSQTVGTTVTLTCGSTQNIKRLFVDWDDELGGDDDIETWKEYETVGTSKESSHVYSLHTGKPITGFGNAGGGKVKAYSSDNNLTNGDTVVISGTVNYNGTYTVSNVTSLTFDFVDVWAWNEKGQWVGYATPSCRIEDENGFWSDITNSSNTVMLNDDTPTAKLRVNVKKETLGDDITLDGSLSQPAGSNVTITKYEFKRDGADSWQNNGTNPVYTFDSGTCPNTVGSKTASLQITTSSGKTDTDTATYELETGSPTSLSFSKDTKIHELNHILGQNKITETPIGSAGVEYEFLISRKAERITLVATSNHPNTGTDIDIIRSAWINNTYVRITVSTEMESHTVQYDCKIDGDISLGHAYDNKQSWTFPIRVIARTEL